MADSLNSLFVVLFHAWVRNFRWSRGIIERQKLQAKDKNQVKNKINKKLNRIGFKCQCLLAYDSIGLQITCSRGHLLFVLLYLNFNKELIHWRLSFSSFSEVSLKVILKYWLQISENHISAKYFTLSLVASVDMNHLDRLLDRVEELSVDSWPAFYEHRVTFEEFKSFRA